MIYILGHADMRCSISAACYPLFLLAQLFLQQLLKRLPTTQARPYWHLVWSPTHLPQKQHHVNTTSHVHNVTCTQFHMYTMSHVHSVTYTQCHMYTVSHIHSVTYTHCNVNTTSHVHSVMLTQHHMYTV